MQHYLHQTQNFQISLESEEIGFLKENACGLQRSNDKPGISLQQVKRHEMEKC